MNQRQLDQVAFDQSDQNIIIGHEEDLPIKLSELISIDAASKGVVEAFESGLTAKVYHLQLEGKHYNLKKKRPESLVKNVDGQTSFLNEVQRRRDFEKLRPGNPILDRGIVKTLYANYREGIMVSEWVEGTHLRSFEPETLDQLFSLTLELEKQGIMEWDLCSGNILISRDGDIKLFDFGYAYPYNPKCAFNSEGLSVPLFNSVERFETRFFMPYLLKLEEKEPECVIGLYQLEKEAAVRTYLHKEKWLVAIKADQVILDVCRNQLKTWQEALASREALENLYMLERIRSYVLDIHDDVMGKSCTPATLKKVDKVVEMVGTSYDFIHNHEGFLWEDQTLSKEALVDKYVGIRDKVMEFQL